MKRLAMAVSPKHVSILILVGALGLLAAAGGLWATDPAGWADSLVGPLTGVETVDQDQDGLADSLENRIGSDPENPHSLGEGVPDGWLFHWYGSAVPWDDDRFLLTRMALPAAPHLPKPLPGTPVFVAPTLAQLYAQEIAWRGAGDGAAWWLQDAVDPTVWDNDGDGIADAWAAAFGIDPLNLDPESPSEDPAMTIRQKYELGLDPTSFDSDGDGLADSSEIKGVTRFQGNAVFFDPTDARAFSTRGDGIADGFLVRFGMDPHDETVAGRMPSGDGVTVREAFNVSRDMCHESGDGACSWLDFLTTGPLLDPTTWDSNDDGIPDAWAMRDPYGIAHPLQITDTVVYSSQDWDEIPWDGDVAHLFGVVVDGANPVPTTKGLTLADLYGYQRPADWSESEDGPWWGGLKTRIDAPDGALPPAVALREWTLRIDTARGAPAEGQDSDDRVVEISAHADPRKIDTDGDGISDMEEYFGVSDGRQTARSNPADSDTDGDGLTDCQELIHSVRRQCEDPEFDGPDDGGLRTHVARRDSSGSQLTDGEEFAYWSLRQRIAHEAGGVDPASGLPADALGPLGNINGRSVDGVPVPNILDADSDSDGLTDGAELQPNRFLPQASGIVRPATDPALADTDSDGLPDRWEVQWSTDRIFACNTPCTLPSGLKLISGWPLDPTLPISVASAVPQAPVLPGTTDADLNYANDRVVDAHGNIREFTNHLAYKYDLDPFEAMTDPLDGIPDMFAIVWGIENVPEFAETPRTRAKADDLAGQLGARQQTLEASHVVIDPRRADDPDAPGAVTVDSNLLGMFGPEPRQKGVWAFVDRDEADQCSFSLPVDGPRRDADLPSGPGLPTIVPGRSDLAPLDPRSAFCWTWVDYPVRADILHNTNPWAHDSTGNGLPDGWEAMYELTSPALRLRQARCDTTLVDGVAALDNCLTVRQAYELGVDPSRSDGDTDRGGVPDWLEVKLDLDPLSSADDSPEQDWSGTGLPNIVELRLGLDPLSPDTDGDGLLDGGRITAATLDGLLDDQTDLQQIFPFLRVTNGDGDLCLPGPGHERYDGDRPVENMSKRPGVLIQPAPGQLGYATLHDWYVTLGILHDLDPGGICPADHTLFKREALQLPDGTWYGAGRDLGSGQPRPSDSLRMDTSGDGVADGWLVYWRDASSSATTKGPLSPGRDTRVNDPNDPDQDWDPDGDLLTTPQEYGGPSVAFDRRPPWASPDDWVSSRDGPWWGGMDPGHGDSSGIRAWLAVGREDGYFCQNPGCRNAEQVDLDSDGVPDRYDVYPAIDHDNVGIMRYDPAHGAYDIDHRRLWDSLEARASWPFADQDSDGIPDFLDRARVKIDNVVIPPGVQLTKDADAEGVVITGRVRLAESEDPDVQYSGTGEGSQNGETVSNVAVKVWGRDETGFEALLGAGFSGADGTFDIPFGVGPRVRSGPCLDAAAVLGMPCAAGSRLDLPSQSLSLLPGTLEIRVETEANTIDAHPVGFGANATAVAFKQAWPDAPLLIPDGTGASAGLGYQAILIDGSGRPSGGAALHTTSGVFPSSTGYLGQIVQLRATTRIDLDLEGESTMVGDLLNVTGRFVDDFSNVPLPGHLVRITLGSEDSTVTETNATGSFSASFETSLLPPGPVTVTAWIDVPEDSSLSAPQPATSQMVLTRSTSWRDITLSGEAVINGGGHDLPVSEGMHLRATLVDHLDRRVAGTSVQARIVTSVAGAPQVVVGPLMAATDATGSIDIHFGQMPAGVPLGALDLEVAQPSSTTEIAETLRIFVSPIYNTEFHGLLNASAPIGEAALLTGSVVRQDGTIAVDDDGYFLFQRADGTGPVARVNQSVADATFAFPVTETGPVATEWRVRYVPGTDQLRGSMSTVWTFHVTPTAIDASVLPALANKEVIVLGHVAHLDGTLTSGSIQAYWNDDMWSVPVTVDGFRAKLDGAPMGVHELRLVFGGSTTEEASSRTIAVPVRQETGLHVAANNITYGSRSPGTQEILRGTLANDTGAGLAQRAIMVNFSAPDRVGSSILATTGNDGSFSVITSDVAPLAPGRWSADIKYAGEALDAGTTATLDFAAIHEVDTSVLHLPGSGRVGETLQVQGTSSALLTGEHLGPIDLVLSLGRHEVAKLSALPGQRWHTMIDVPAVVAGTHELRVTGSSANPEVRVLSAAVELTVSAGVDAHISESLGDARAVTITLRHTGSEKPVSDAEIILLRSRDGYPLEAYTLRTGPDGQASLSLARSLEGNLSILSIRGSAYELEAQTSESSNVLSSAPAKARAGLVVLGLVSALLIAAVFLIIVWRRRRRREIAGWVDEARRTIITPGMEPAKAIQILFERLVQLLDDAGGRITERHTARDVATVAGRAFRLPMKPMLVLGDLYEQARYSSHHLDLDDQQRASSALEGLASALNDPSQARIP